ncbi:uncharacterized protein RMCFA_1946 [Mycolicibacterium fortuitum subsp. acetamidolyticum]|uniref:Uncharacterized protein n=1 Tax=Mycolicibacterium fortuitum subsp. acetamidolyticum TaxID=144550 RepID=A0A100WPJ9_MYCFO|nr:uncharacterized protein RMCFA_1946 [Mycolicibacterium fortuitum subsp. acetamidolyticum]
MLTDRQVGVGDGRDSGLAGEHEAFRGRDVFGDLGGVTTAEIPEPTAQPVGVADRQTVEAGAQLSD